MTYEEAIAPLKKNEGKFWARCNFIMRGRIRHEALIRNIDYYEEKRFFTSTFRFRGDAAKIISLIAFIREYNGDFVYD